MLHLAPPLPPALAEESPRVFLAHPPLIGIKLFRTTTTLFGSLSTTLPLSVDAAFDDATLFDAVPLARLLFEGLAAELLR